ncbi:MAG: cupredoxin domain-containing protein [Acidimicrobiales bacterium]
MPLRRSPHPGSDSSIPGRSLHARAVPDPPRSRRFPQAVVVVVLLATLLSACTTATTSSRTTTARRSGPTPAATQVPAAATVTIKNFAFSPSTLTVRPRARITVINRDPVTHTLTSTTRVFNTGEIASGHTVTFTAPGARGTYPYLCLIHQYMTGTLIVS